MLYIALMILSVALFIVGAWRLPPCWEPVGMRDAQGAFLMLAAIVLACTATAMLAIGATS